MEICSVCINFKYYLANQKIDLAFVDSYLAGEQIYREIQSSVNKLVCIDDTNRIKYPFGSTILNPGFGGKYLPYNHKDNVILTGEDYILLRKPFREKFIIPQIKEKVERIFLSIGGDDKWNYTPQILILLKEKFPNVLKEVIVSAGYKNLEEINAVSDDKTNIHLGLSAEEMRELMLTVDLAITAGGQTTYELACCCVPMLIVQTVDNQSGNIKGFNELGLFTINTNESKILLKNLSEKLDQLKSKVIRYNHKKILSHIKSDNKKKFEELVSME